MTKQKKQPNPNLPPKPIQIQSSKTSLFDEIESSVEDHLYKLCQKYDIFCIKLLPSKSGIPDRILIGNGKVIFIELKSPGKKPRPLQVAIIKQMRAHGAIVYVLDTKDVVTKTINKEFKEVISNA
ncbi:MAG TPA: VRR-NUC domain-containing protein [Lachnospiraceae bacterium]|nr:VRR-NUC domain-containing protein [Lachnospiraceae bacterium]